MPTGKTLLNCAPALEPDPPALPPLSGLEGPSTDRSSESAFCGPYEAGFSGPKPPDLAGPSEGPKTGFSSASEDDACFRLFPGLLSTAASFLLFFGCGEAEGERSAEGVREPEDAQGEDSFALFLPFFSG